MEHVGAGDERLASTNSQPSYVLWLLHLLGIEPGQTVLEIGSGSGWLAAILGRLVGPNGHVTGVEIIPELAAQSQADLAAVNAANVTIVAGDGNRLLLTKTAFDRVMIAAGIWDFPVSVFDQVAEGGLVLAPIEIRGTDRCRVTVFRRQGDGFDSLMSLPGGFVPLIGDGQQRGGQPYAVSIVSVEQRNAARSRLHRPLPLGRVRGRSDSPIAREFCAFLGKTEPGFTLLDLRTVDGIGVGAGFGLVESSDGSVAFWRDGELRGQDGPSAFDRLQRAYERWAQLGLPGSGSWDLSIVRAGTLVEPSALHWIEQRGETDLLWTLRPDLA